MKKAFINGHTGGGGYQEGKNRERWRGDIQREREKEKGRGKIERETDRSGGGEGGGAIERTREQENRVSSVVLPDWPVGVWAVIHNQ